MIRGGARARVAAGRTVLIERPEALRGSSDVGLFSEFEPVLFLVDGNNLLWRAAHGHPAPFPAADGRDLTPLFRFFSLLRRALGSYALFAECIVCFDGAEAWSSRLEIDDGYKANRRYDDADLAFMGWLPEIKAALGSSGVAFVEVEDREADDVIATLAAGRGTRPVRIFSTDRDFFQLLGPTLTVLNTRHRPAVVGPTELIERYGVSPGLWCDLRALAGDPSDGIPGLPNIGPKRAARVLQEGVGLDELHAAGLLPEEIVSRWEDVCRWRRLIRLRTDLRLDLDPSGQPTPALPAPSTVCRELGLVG